MSDSWIIARSPCRIHPSGNLMSELSEALAHRTGASFLFGAWIRVGLVLVCNLLSVGNMRKHLMKQCGGSL